MITTFTFKKKKENVFIPIILPFLLTFFLFFIDEGYFDFRWMKDAANWFLFAVYNVAFLLGECIVNLVFLRKYKGHYKITLTCVLGITVGALLLTGLFYSF